MNKSSSTNKPDGTRWKNRLQVASGIAGILGVLISVYFGAKEPRPDVVIDNQSGGITAGTVNTGVVSNNQLGGITAGTINISSVNVGASERHLDDALRGELISVLANHSNVYVEAIFGDAEAHQFAEEIRSFLAENGWNINPFVGLGYYTKPIRGGEIRLDDNGNPIIIIGTNTPSL